MDNFEDVLNQHKEKARKVYAESGEGNLVNSALREIESNCADYEYYFQMGQQSKQKRINELQGRNHTLNDNIKEQGRKLVYQNEVIETQAEKLLGLRDERAELQKQVDAVYLVLDGLKKARYMHSENKKYNSILIEKLEQALKGGEV